MSVVVRLGSTEPRKRTQAKPLTATRIRKLKPRARQYWEPDGGCPGLYVRINTGGEMSFYVRGRIGSGRGAPQRNIRIGDVTRMGLADARTKALALLAEMRSGRDPVRTAARTPTVRELIDGYGASLDRRGVVNHGAAVSSLRRNLCRMAKAPTDSLSRADIVREIERCHDETGPAAAMAFRGFTAAMLNWAVNTGQLQSSVLAGYKAPRRTKAQRLAQRRQPILTGADGVRRFWVASEAAADPIFRDYMRFLLLTGQRRGETSEMTWDDLSGDRWTIRAEVAKMGRDHLVPLGPLSLELLSAQHRQSHLVWPGRGGVPMSGWSKRLRPIKAAMVEPGLALHALRRGYRTGIRELGADADLCELMIGHTRDGLVARYDKSEMWEARRSIQLRWEDWIAQITRGLS